MMSTTLERITTAKGLLTVGELAEALGLQPKTLYNWSTGKTLRGPRAMRLPNGSVRYDPAAVAEWLASKDVEADQ